MGQGRPRPKDPATYAQRNRLHSKAAGALANVQAAQRKLRRTKRPAKWLLEYLKGIEERLHPVAEEMARHRDEAW